jgi:hypothetical protein
MSRDGYVAKSDICDAVAEIMAEFIPEGASFDERKEGILKGMDGAHKIAKATGLMGSEPRLALGGDPDTHTSPEEEVEHLLNESLAYYFSSDTALAVTTAARDRLAKGEYVSSVTFGFAVGLMMANHGRAEVLRDLQNPDEPERYRAAAEALASSVRPVQHSGEVFIG